MNELIDRSGAQGDSTFTYDSNGSLIADGARTFEWDGANRLVAVVIGTHRSEFSYDGIGRRTRIVEKDNSVITSEHTYVWCGGEICEERDASGATVQKRFYEQGEQVNGGSGYYTFDHLGSVRELLDYRGVMMTKYDYDPWGRQTKLIGTRDAAFGYAGYFGHQQSGLLLTWYRAYDANLARWISRDPIQEAGGSNLYAFVANGPVNSIDADGLKKVQSCCRGLFAFRGLLRWQRHCFIRIINDNGTVDTYGVLGDPGSRRNQKVQKNDTGGQGGSDRNSAKEKDCKDVKGLECQIDRLVKGLEDSATSGTCPPCGAKYQLWFVRDLFDFFDGFNSNTYVFNMIQGAGMVPPKQTRAPGYHTAPGAWYSN